MSQLTPNASRPQLNRQAGQSPQEAVQARPGSYLGALPGDGGELHGLLQGLASFDASLQPLIGERIEDHRRETAKAEAAARQGAIDEQTAAANRVADPRGVLTGAPDPSLPAVPTAFSAEALRSRAGSLANRVGIQVTDDARKEFDTKQHDPEFVRNIPQWLTGVRQQALSGVQDAHAATVIGDHVTALEGQFKAEAEKQRMLAADASTATSLDIVARNAITNTLAPQDIPMAFEVVRGTMADQTSARAISKAFIQAALTQSAKMGGAPDLIDALRQPNKDGKTITDGDAEMDHTIDVAYKQAVEQRQRATHEAAQGYNQQAGMAFEAAIKGRDMTTLMQYGPDFINSHSGKDGYFSHPKEAATALGQWLDAKSKLEASGVGIGLAQAGTLFRAEGSVVNKTLDQMFSPSMDKLIQAAASGDVQGAAGIFTGLTQQLSATGTNKPWDQLKGFVESLASNLPSKDGPSPKFLIAAAAYKALSANPAFVKDYFPDDIAHILDSFNEAAPGSDQKGAYEAAYAGVDPAKKAARDSLLESPAWKAKKAETLGKLVGGTNWTANIPIIGSWFRPDEHSRLAVDMQRATGKWYDAHPFASDKQLLKFAEGWVGRNFAFDKTTGQPVRVPEAIGGVAASDAISAYTKLLIESTGLAASDMWPVLVMQGNTGRMSVGLYDGTATRALGDIDMSYLLRWRAGSKVYEAGDVKQIGAMKDALRSNSPLPDMRATTMDKAVALGAFNQKEMQQIHQRQIETFQATIGKAAGISFGDYKTAPTIPLPKPGAGIDNKLTSSAAQSFLQLTPSMWSMPEARGTSHRGLALALITMGEGVALKPYQDPNPAAGMNIGMGYNLKANGETVDADLKVAGVARGAIEAVKAGRAALTVEQSKSLLREVLPRYELQAKAAADSEAPGLWERMTPQQRAVMIDVGYQTGDSRKFRQAFAAAVRGDDAAFREHTQVSYMNKERARVVDLRRGGLRAALLAGTGIFQARVGQLATIPSNALQAAQNQPR